MEKNPEQIAFASKLLGLQKIVTLAYYGQAKEMPDYMQIKAALCLRDNIRNCSEELTLVLFGLQSSHRENFGGTPSEFVYQISDGYPIFLSYTRDVTDVAYKLKEEFRTVNSNLIHHWNLEKMPHLLVASQKNMKILIQEKFCGIASTYLFYESMFNGNFTFIVLHPAGTAAGILVLMPVEVLLLETTDKSVDDKCADVGLEELV
uniref:Uncharacterized protein n=1 Tax=Glossina austeni TaxID=7395 RepID=A0A1A9V1R3_GLOAU